MTYKIIETETEISVILDSYPDNKITVNWVKFEEDLENDCLIFKFDYDGTNDPTEEVEYKEFTQQLGDALIEIIQEQSKNGTNMFKGGA